MSARLGGPREAPLKAVGLGTAGRAGSWGGCAMGQSGQDACSWCTRWLFALPNTPGTWLPWLAVWAPHWL